MAVHTQDNRMTEEYSRLRAGVTARARTTSQIQDIPAFEEYETWCATRGLCALPANTNDLTLYLLELAASGTLKHILLGKARSIYRINLMLNQVALRRLEPNASNACLRAIDFARISLQRKRFGDGDYESAREAIKMFPDGKIPMRWEQNAA